MPPRGCLPNPCPMGAVDSRVTRSVGVGRAATARVLPDLQKPPPGKDLAGGPASPPLLFMVLVLASFCSSLASALPWFYLPCRARCGGARGSDCPCTVIGVQKCTPPFCTPTGAPGPGPHISAMRCWARPKNGVQAGGAVFYRGKFFRALRLPRFPRVVRCGRGV